MIRRLTWTRQLGSVAIGAATLVVVLLFFNTFERLRLHDESALFLVPNLLSDGASPVSEQRAGELLQPDASPLAQSQRFSPDWMDLVT